MVAKTGRILAVAGGALVCVGFFLPWVVASSATGSTVVYSAYEAAIGQVPKFAEEREMVYWLVFMIGLMSLAMGAMRIWVGTLVFGAANAILLTLMVYAAVDNTVTDLLGFGFWIVYLGSYLCLISGIVLLLEKKKESIGSPMPVGIPVPVALEHGIHMEMIPQDTPMGAVESSEAPVVDDGAWAAPPEDDATEQPQAVADVDHPEVDCPKCGTTFAAIPDDEGMITCTGCGIQGSL